MIKKSVSLFAGMLCLAAAPIVMADYPVGYQDQYSVGKSTVSNSFSVLSNDQGTDLKIAEFNQWSVKGGRISRDSADRGKQRNLVYQAPTNNFIGEDEFWYVLVDAQGRRNAAKVKVSVKPTALNPQDDKVSVNKGTSIRINALENDSVVLIGPRTIVKIVEFNEWSRNGGRIKLETRESGTPKQFNYTPRPGFTGIDEFWYAIARNGGTPEAARVVINVTENQSAAPYPVGKADDLTYVYNTRDTDYAYFPLDNDRGTNLRIVNRSGYSQKGGTYTVSDVGTLRYSPQRSLVESGGNDKIWYIIEDALGRKNWSVINFTVPAFSR